jgi:hypothetical protein
MTVAPLSQKGAAVLQSMTKATRSLVAFFFPKKLQNVMAVTDCLPCFGNLHTTKKGALP